jgi:1-acyl-sn-glycerol-3-phosphate acyltransferase
MPRTEPGHVVERQFRIRVLRAVNVCFTRIYHRVQVLAPCPLPRRGPAILVCNHISGLDPVMLQALTPRLIVWMTAREYCGQRGLAWLFRTVRAIAVKRGEPDLSATRQALRALGAGHVLGIFPEGHIADSRELLPFQTGAALLAARTGVPIYPAAIEGSQRGHEMLGAYLIPQRAVVTFGPPLRLGGSDGGQPPAEQGTELIRSAVEQLRQHLIQRAFEKNMNKINTVAGN